jgi:alanine dehydrogenase
MDHLLTLGVLATSAKQHERRLPIHPHHVERIDPVLRAHIVMEQGYGQRYGVSDEHLAPLVGAMRPRQEVLDAADVVLLPKPTVADLEAMHEGQVLWGWPHAVQDRALTQISIDKHLTLIAWEAMNHWTPGGTFVVHVFHLNNELAGYCSVLHAMTLAGVTGAYGRHHAAAVIGFGNTARGAVNALRALEVHDITVLTMRDITAVASPIPGVVLHHLNRVPGERSRTTVHPDEGEGPELAAATFLAQHDLVVNCVLQDPDDPLMFVTDAELAAFQPGALLVDVSCDRGMGFEFARPTSFGEPLITVGDGVGYYAVDHSPAYLWNSATWTISEALLPYLPVVMAGPTAWEADLTISRAIEVREGVVRNPKILSFQRRSEEFPHVPR